MPAPLYIVIVWSELLTVVGFALLIAGVFLAAFKRARLAVLPVGLGAVALLGVWMNSVGAI
jgi:uncharacterized membrane protein